MPTQTYQLIPIDALRPSSDPAQRPVDPTDPAIAELAASIADVGLLEPLLVRAAPDAEGEFVVVAGHRRLAALTHLHQHSDDAGGMDELINGVPCLVRGGSSREGEDTIAALVENLQRVGLTPLQEATALRVLRDDHGWTQAAIASAIGRNQGHVSKRLTLLRLTPELLAGVDAGTITIEVGVDVARLPRAAQDAVAALIAQGRAADHAYETTRRRFAQLADRTKLTRALAAGQWPHLAGILIVDETQPDHEATLTLHRYGYPGAIVAADPQHGYAPALLAAGVPADQIAVVVRDRPTQTYPTGDLDAALNAWTQVLVSEQARQAVHDARALAGAPSPRTEGLGALIPDRSADLPTATGPDVDHADRVVVDDLPSVLPTRPPGEDQQDADYTEPTDTDPRAVDGDVLAELDLEGVGHDPDLDDDEPTPWDPTAGTGLLGWVQAALSALDRATLHPELLDGSPEEELLTAAANMTRDVHERLYRAQAALDADQYAPDAQATSSSPAPQEEPEAAPTTDDAAPPDADAADVPARSGGNGGAPIHLDRSSRVRELRAALLAAGVTQVQAEAGTLVAVAGARRAWLEAAVAAYNEGLAAAEAGA